MARTHGLASTYRNGCRCDECRVAHSAWFNQKNAERRARTAAGEIPGQHGRWATYSNWGCRCDECTAVARDYNAQKWRRRKKTSA